MNGRAMNQADLEMRCDELVGLVTDYLEGTISEPDRARFERHIRECEWCDRYVKQTRAVVKELGEIGEAPPDPDALNQALIAFREAHRGDA